MVRGPQSAHGEESGYGQNMTQRAGFLLFCPIDWLTYTADQRSLGLEMTSKDPQVFKSQD